MASRTNIKSTQSSTSPRFRKPYINSQEYPDYMRIVPAQYVYKTNPNIPHSLYKKPYGEYSEDYQAMELTWNQKPWNFEWRPDWDLDIPDVYVPDLDVTAEEVAVQYETYTIEANSQYEIQGEYDQDWNTAHNANTGVLLYDCADPEAGSIGLVLVRKNQYGYFKINRSFMSFDLSAYSGTVETAKILFSDPNIPDATITVQRGTQGDSAELGDYDAFTGGNFGTLTPSQGENELVLNQSGVDYINSQMGGTVYFAFREYYFDYLDEEFPGTGEVGATIHCYAELEIYGLLSGPSGEEPM